MTTATGASAVTSVGGTAAAQDGERHTVEMTDSLVFEPDSITIAPGDTIAWVNVGSIGHSVTAYEDEIPQDAEYFASGGFDAEGQARNSYTAGNTAAGDVPGGESFRHTFDVVGSYEYFCIPHEGVGMVGSIDVTPGGAPEGGDGPAIPTIPDTAWTLIVVTTVALLTVTGLAYIFIKYGGDYELGDEE
ncbi:plastocyanin/azurin family copper-binding protein [Haloarchaeobius litoreus]|uniref:Plastocyanin/azurin family copper-binding protein n=1 Tax=Haloarchaeobius litoreus TaxID=755306 RepID=A0ABD6DMZ1_9EURY|nr:plastocyanin/azurin family copper-binding protein [Haloarchaeobius litoreus]